MICPQTKMECIQRLGCDAFGCYTKKSDADADILASERARSERAKTSRNPSPPPPTLAEIERLVDSLGNVAIAMGGSEPDQPTHKDYQAVKVTLMAAIKNYGAHNGQT